MTEETDIEKTWRDKIDDRNIMFRSELHKLFFRPLSPLVVNEIYGIFKRVFTEYTYDPCFKINVTSHDDGSFEINWEVPTDECHSFRDKGKSWYFSLVFKYEFNENFKDEIEKAFN